MNADELTVPESRDAWAEGQSATAQEYYHSRSLYHLQDEFASLLARIEADGGELSPETDAALAINEAEFAAKAEAYAYAIRSLEAFGLQCLNEINRLRDRQATAERTADRLKDKIRDALIQRGGAPVNAGTFRLSLRRSSAVEIDNGDQIPPDYRVVETVEKIDKRAIGDAIKSGRPVPGAVLIERQNLQIK